MITVKIYIYLKNRRRISKEKLEIINNSNLISVHFSFIILKSCLENKHIQNIHTFNKILKFNMNIALKSLLTYIINIINLKKLKINIHLVCTHQMWRGQAAVYASY